MRVFGLTGGIAAGKTAVAQLLRQRGFDIIDADQVSRQTVAPGSQGLAQIKALFGPGMIRDDGSLDRRALRLEIARSKQSQTRLNQLLHPLIREHIQQQIDQRAKRGVQICFVEAALMIETGSFRDYEAVFLVTAPTQLRLQRLLQRDGMQEEAARQLMGRQMSDAEKRPGAHCEIINDGSLAHLEEQLDICLQKLNITPSR